MLNYIVHNYMMLCGPLKKADSFLPSENSSLCKSGLFLGQEVFGGLPVSWGKVTIHVFVLVLFIDGGSWGRKFSFEFLKKWFWFPSMCITNAVAMVTESPERLRRNVYQV